MVKIFLRNFLMVFIFLPFSVSAALIEYVGSRDIDVAHDGVERNVYVSLVFDDVFNKVTNIPQVPGSDMTDVFGFFDIPTYTVEIDGIGVFAGNNGRFNIWYNRTPAAFDFYTEELEILQNHNLMLFYDGSGNPWDWAPWLDNDKPQYVLSPELVITRLNIAPGLYFDFGNDLHLFPVPEPSVVLLYGLGLIMVMGTFVNKKDSSALIGV